MTLVLVRLLCLAGLLFLLHSPGRLIRRSMLRAELGSRALNRLADFILGSAAWTVALFAAGSLQCLNSTTAWMLAGLALGTFLVDRVVFRRRRAQTVLWRLGPPELMLAAVSALLVVPLLVEAMTGDVSWDAGVYHLAVPKIWIAHGGFRPVELLVYAHWPLGAELFFALAMLLDDYVLAKLLQGGFALLLLLPIRAALPDRGMAFTGIAWLLVLANPVVISELPLAYVDIIQAFAMTAGLAFVLQALRVPANRDPALVLAGVAGGLAAGMKLNGFVGTSILGGLALAGLVNNARARGQSPMSQALRPVLVRFAPPALLLWLPWAIKSLLWTGNPLFPVAHSLFGGPDWSPQLTQQLMAWQQGIGMGREPLDWLLLPFRVVLQGGPGYHHFDGELNRVWLMVVPLACWGAWRGDRTARLGLMGGALFFLVWGLSSQQLRLLIPGLPFLAIAASATAGYGLERLKRATPLAGWGIFLAMTTVATAADSGRFLRARAVADSLALVTRDADLAAAVPPVMRFVNRTLPEDAVVAMLNVNRQFYCDREVIADSFFEASQLGALLAGAETGAEVHRRLQARGVTHVLWARRNWGIAWPPGLADMAQDSSLVQAVHPDDSVAILALLPAR